MVGSSVLLVNPETVSKAVDENGAPLVVYHGGLAMNAAKEQASRLLTHANLCALIEERQRNLSATVGVTREAVIAGLMVLR